MRGLLILPAMMALLACWKPSRISDMEKQQINKLMSFGVITMTVEERRYFDEIKNNHLKRLDFLYEVAQQEKTRGMSILLPEKIGLLQSFQELIRMDKKLYRVECLEAGYNCDDIH